MPRPSKLSEKQWAEVERRHLSGETISDLAREYKLSKANISRKVAKRNATTKTVARSLAEAELSLQKLDISQQRLVRTLADDLKSISSHLSGAASLGAMTAHRLSMIANEQVEQIDSTANLAANEGSLKSVLAMTRGANDAAQIGLSLLAANKDNLPSDQTEPLSDEERSDRLAAIFESARKRRAGQTSGN